MCGIKRLFKISPETAFLTAFIALAVGGLGTLAYTKHMVEYGPITGEHTHWYGTVRHIGNCRSGKHSLRCHVYVEGREKSYYMDVTNFPGDNLQPGDRIGIFHRERKYGTQSYLRRNDRLMSSGLYVAGLGSLARYNEEHGYSK